jgi:hypothetical protein
MVHTPHWGFFPPNFFTLHESLNERFGFILLYLSLANCEASVASIPHTRDAQPCFLSELFSNDTLIAGFIYSWPLGG